MVEDGGTSSAIQKISPQAVEATGAAVGGRGLLILKRSPEKHRSPRLKVRKRRGESGLHRTSFRCVLLGRNPGRRRWWWNDRWTVVASNSIGQFPRGQPGSGSAAANVAAEIDQRELRPGRREGGRTAVIDANGAYVAGLHVLEGCRTGHPCADHRGARAVNPVIFEVHVRDRVQVFYGEIADQHDRVVGVVKKAVADHLNVCVNTVLYGVT